MERIKYYGEKNNQRMPNFHRLDVCLNYTKETRLLDYKFSMGAYNVYGRKNPYYLVESAEGITQVSLFSMLPYVSFSVKF